MRVLAARDHGYRGAVVALLLRAAGPKPVGWTGACLRSGSLTLSPASVVARSARDAGDAEAAGLRLTVTPAGGAHGG